MHTHDNLLYSIALSLIPGIGSVRAKKLVAYTGSAEAVFTEKLKKLLLIPDIGPKAAKAIADPEILNKAEKEVLFVTKHKLNALYYLDKRYPERLKHCEDSPVMLYTRGDIDYNQSKIINIIGTRKATDYGKHLTYQLLKDLKEQGQEILVVSGLAYGIDSYAHKAALENKQQTLAVLGHGLNKVYPAAHKNLAQQIVEQNGALMTEFTSSDAVAPENFVRRNRIVAGIADATIVIESADQGGALITAQMANQYNRDIFAFPGRITDKYSAGCNKLIRTNQASMIESAEDLLYIMGWKLVCETQKAVQKQLFVELSPDEQTVLNILIEKGEMAIDALSIQVGFPVSKVSALLLNLEFSGLVQNKPGAIYCAR